MDITRFLQKIRCSVCVVKLANDLWVEKQYGGKIVIREMEARISISEIDSFPLLF